MNLGNLKREIKDEFPSFELVQKKDSWLMKVIDFFLKLITLWQMKTFMERFTTTIGYTIYIPERWTTMTEVNKAGILRHERVHMRQAKKYSRPLYYFLYLFFPLPVVWAYFRMKFEMEGYAETLRHYYELHGSRVLRDKTFREGMVRNFTTATYFWMWPWRKRIESWYDATVLKLEGVEY